jgi:hypothetical protein
MKAALEAGADGAGHSLLAFPVALAAGLWWWAWGMPARDASHSEPGDEFRRMSDERDFS